MLVDGLTITDSRARWRVCWRVHVGVHVARGMLDYSAQLSTALNYSSSHHSSCVRGSSGPSMRVSVLSQYSTASRFKLEHAVSVLPSPLSSLLSRMYAVRHTFTCIAYIMAAVGHLGSLSVSCDIRGSRCITRWQRMMMRMKPKPPRMKPKPPIANETEPTYSE